MKKFNKLLSVLLTVTLCLSLAAPAFAEGEPAGSDVTPVQTQEQAPDTAVTPEPDPTTEVGDGNLNDADQGGTPETTEPIGTPDGTNGEGSAIDDAIADGDSDDDAIVDDDGDDDAIIDDDGDDDAVVDDDGDDDAVVDDGNQEFSEVLQDTAAAVMSAPQRMMARAAGASLDVDHKAEQPEDPGEGSGSSSTNGIIHRGTLTDEEKENLQEFTAYTTDGTDWSKGVTVYVDKTVLPENPVKKQSYPLAKPITERLEDGTTVTWTRMKLESDGRWHLDGVILEEKDEKFGFGVASIQDQSGVYGEATESTGNAQHWYDFSAEDLEVLNSKISKISLPKKYMGEDMVPPVPEDIQKAANAILQSKGWAAGDDAIKWRFSWHQSNGWHLDGLVQADKATNQENIAIVIKDATGQINEATGREVASWAEKQGIGPWHNIATGEFILPDPTAYGQGATYTPSEAQLKQIEEYVSGIAGLDHETGEDGTISWKFVCLGEGDSRRWDLQGVYTPNYAHVYVYVSGTEVPEGAQSNGRPVTDSDREQVSENSTLGDNWYTVGEVKIPYDAIKSIQSLLTEENRGSYVENQVKETLLTAIKEAMGDESDGFTQYGSEQLWNDYLSRIDWMGIKVEKGADNYVAEKYLTLHLNGFIGPEPTEPTEPTNPGSTGGSGGGGGGGRQPSTPSENPPEVDVPDPDVPLVDVPEVDPPLVDIPEEEPPLVELPEEEVPLADVPKTGDRSLLWQMSALLSAVGLMVLKAFERKQDDEA